MVVEGKESGVGLTDAMERARVKLEIYVIVVEFGRPLAEVHKK